jgi:hypothetical protein
MKIILTILFFVFSSQVAYAYIDPVSVSFVLQGLAGLVAAILSSIRSVREKCITLIKKIFINGK